MERLSSIGLKYDYPPVMRPYVSELSALQNCQKAIELITLAETQKENGNENWMMNAQFMRSSRSLILLFWKFAVQLYFS